MENKRFNLDIKKLVYLAILTALVCILQVVSNITAPFMLVSITLTLVPVVLGVAIVDKWAGVWLGFVSAVTILLTGAAAGFLTINPFGTIVTVLVKGTMSGLLAGVVYSLFEKKRYLAITLAGIAAPVTNTGIFIIGCYVFFYDYVVSLMPNAGDNVFIYIITTFAGINFLVELGLNIILSPVILRLVNLKKAE